MQISTTQLKTADLDKQLLFCPFNTGKKKASSRTCTTKLHVRIIVPGQ